MKWRSLCATIGMTELFVEPRWRTSTNCNALRIAMTSRGLRTGIPGISIHDDGLRADELGFELGLAIVEQHRNHFVQIRMQLIQGCPLTMRPGETRDVAYV